MSEERIAELEGERDGLLQRCKGLTYDRDRARKRVDTQGKELRMLRDKVSMYQEAVNRGGFDLSVCGGCNEPVVCLPDGLPICADCAKKEG